MLKYYANSHSEKYMLNFSIYSGIDFLLQSFL